MRPFGSEAAQIRTGVRLSITAVNLFIYLIPKGQRFVIVHRDVSSDK
jgi:hypothetical protein